MKMKLQRKLTNKEKVVLLAIKSCTQRLQILCGPSSILYGPKFFEKFNIKSKKTKSIVDFFLQNYKNGNDSDLDLPKMNNLKTQNNDKINVVVAQKTNHSSTKNDSLLKTSKTNKHEDVLLLQNGDKKNKNESDNQHQDFNKNYDNDNSLNLKNNHVNDTKIARPTNDEPSKPFKSENVDDLLSKANSIDDIFSILDNFHECTLRTGQTNTVLMDGRQNSDVILIGEAPGETENEQRIPFCGRSGQLLRNILKTINLSTENNLYITNCAFWRPPGNRKPTSQEISTCKPFVLKQVDIVKPKLIILSGATAVKSILGIESSITKICGTQIKVQIHGSSYTCIPIYHPSYLLRNPLAKKRMFYDIVEIDQFLNEKRG